jgi:ParB-like chromosome segregation protein Spo0J
MVRPLQFFRNTEKHWPLPEVNELLICATHADRQLSELARLTDAYKRALNFDPWAENQLSRSIRTEGVVFPLIVLRRELLDGSRRLRLANDIGLDGIPVYLASTEMQAARMLWRIHPERAWLRFVAGKRLTVTMAADLLGTTPDRIPDRRELHRRRKATR